MSEQSTLLPPSPPTVMEEVVNSNQLINPGIIEQNVVESPPQAPLQAPLPVRENIEIQEKLIPGKFKYIKDKYERIMLSNAWQAITMTETWNFVKQPTESFMMSNDKRIWIITAKMEELGYNGHSGCSFGWTMRQMQYIARNGEENYKKSREKNN